jgi:hypothetical protein
MWDVMLIFWGNSQAANERHLKKVDENTRRMVGRHAIGSILIVLYISTLDFLVYIRTSW